MLIVSDIDGTLATKGNWFVRWMAREANLDVAEQDLARLQYGFEFWELPQVRALEKERRAELRLYAHAHHKDSDHQENCVPIPGAREALHALVSQGATIIYTTCRQPEAERRTRAWLERYDFPSAQQVYICPFYHSKYVFAHQQAKPDEFILLIDDLIEKMVPAFRTLAVQQRDLALSLVRRLALVAVGKEEPPVFHKLPLKVLALPSWRPEDVARLAS